MRMSNLLPKTAFYSFMHIIYKHILRVILVAFSWQGFAQDCPVVENLTSLPERMSGQTPQGKQHRRVASTESLRISLPFFDDFSKPGQNWSKYPLLTDADLKAVHFFELNRQKGLVVGSKGVVYRTGNSGSTWAWVESNTRSTILDLAAKSNDSLAIAVAQPNLFCQTTDFGKTWDTLRAPTSQRLKGIQYLASGSFFVWGDSSTLLESVDNGANWINQNWLQPWRNRNFYQVLFRTPSSFWASADSSLLLKTTNGGQSWDSVTVDTLFNNLNFYTVYFRDNLRGLVGSDSGRVYVTGDGGETWAKTQLPTLGKIRNHFFRTNGEGWVLGDSGAFFYTNDLGLSWQRINSGTFRDLNDVQILPSGKGWLVAEGGRLQTQFESPSSANNGLWEPFSGVFINNSYGVDPPSVGVATFDGTDFNGLPYSATYSVGYCDTLTSLPIDLSGIPLNQSNSVYLSCYIQAGGQAQQLNPDRTDNIVVEFLNPVTGIWDESELKIFGGNGLTPFKFYSVQIPIEYFNLDFRFRFRNVGSRNGNFDNWNVDYVKLDLGRTATDSAATDVAVANQFNNYLSRYSAIPVQHFPAAVTIEGDQLFGGGLRSGVRNFNNGAVNANADLQITNLNTGELIQEITTDRIAGLNSPLDEGGLLRRVSIPSALLNFQAPTVDTRLGFRLALRSDPTFNDFSFNDTIRRVFSLEKEYAYDDGSAELRIFIGGNNARGAAKYKIYETDTITDIRLQSPRTSISSNRNITFRLLCFSQIGIIPGEPDSLLFTANALLNSIDSTNKFNTYSLRNIDVNRRILRGNRNYYFGWQNGIVDNGNELRVGLDINTEADSVLHYNTGTGWRRFVGNNFSPMIRPVFGKATLVSVKDKIESNKTISVYPNPTQGNMQVAGQADRVMVYDRQGKLVLDQKFNTAALVEIALPGKLPNGLYVLRAYKNDEPFRPVSFMLMR